MFHPAYSQFRVLGGQSLYWKLKTKCGNPSWTGHHSTAVCTHTHTHTHTYIYSYWDNLDMAINLTCISLRHGRKLEYPEKAYTDMRMYKLHTDSAWPGIDFCFLISVFSHEMKLFEYLV